MRLMATGVAVLFSHTLGTGLAAAQATFTGKMTARAKALIVEQGVTWTQVRTETAEAISHRFRIGVHPTYILLDPAGRIVSWDANGQPPLRGPKLRDTLQRLLPAR